MKCEHPDHNEFETCEDRAVGCDKNCTCCMGKSDDVFYTVETVFNGRREFPICLSLETIAAMRLDSRYSFIGEPQKMSYGPNEVLNDCAIWGNE